MNDDAGSTSGPRISRRWIAALVLVLALNVSLVAWSMSVSIEPAPENVVVTPAPSSAKAPLPVAPTKAADIRPAPAIDTTVNKKPDHGPGPNPPTASPAAPRQPVVAESQPVLTIVNPRQTGGPVHYAVDGEVFCLQAGQYHQLPGNLPRLVEFDRGDDYGYAEERASEGTLAFEVGTSGWLLKQVDSQQAKSLLEACQPTASRP